MAEVNPVAMMPVGMAMMPMPTTLMMAARNLPQDMNRSINRNLQLYLFPDFICFFFCALKLRPRIDSVILSPWNNMDVDMRNRLACAFVACIEKIDALITAVVDQMIGYIFYCPHKVC